VHFVSPETLPPGAHTLTLKLTDILLADSPLTTRAFTVAAATWKRLVGAGTIIADASISHRDDMTELLQRVNAVRRYTGLTDMTLPGALGQFAAWQAQMEALESGIAACYTATGRPAPAFSTVPGYPAAAIINEIRAAIAAA